MICVLQVVKSLIYICFLTIPSSKRVVFFYLLMRDARAAVSIFFIYHGIGNRDMKIKYNIERNCFIIQYTQTKFQSDDKKRDGSHGEKEEKRNENCLVPLNIFRTPPKSILLRYVNPINKSI